MPLHPVKLLHHESISIQIGDDDDGFQIVNSHTRGMLSNKGHMVLVYIIYLHDF